MVALKRSSNYFFCMTAFPKIGGDVQSHATCLIVMCKRVGLYRNFLHFEMCGDDDLRE
jgi:hypothetical protein